MASCFSLTWIFVIKIFSTTSAFKINVTYPPTVSENGSSSDGYQDKGLISWDDATWILTSAFIIFTMQSGKYNKRPNKLVSFSFF